jgi:hypothetical protein
MATVSLHHPATLGHTHHLVDPRLTLAAVVPFAAGFAIAWRLSGATYLAAMTATLLVAIAWAALLSRSSHRGLFVAFIPAVLLATVLLGHGVFTPLAVVDALVLALLIANVLLVSESPDDRTTTLVSTLFTIAFALPIVWGIYAGPFRLTAVFFGVPLAIFSTEMLDRKHDHAPHIAETATLLTFVVTGLALALAELIG